MKQYYNLMDNLVKLEIINLNKVADHVDIDAILGFTALQSSFKTILGLGILLLARESGELKEGQPVIESTSGSLGVALAWSSKLLGHPLHIVVDEGMSQLTLKKIELLGANILFADKGEYKGGFQEARENKLKEVLGKNPNFYNINQHHNPLNPKVYERWLLPYLEEVLDFNNISAGVFTLGTGGHFIALSKMLRKYNIPSYVAERVGSITFGGEPSPSVIRGSGNQLYVPKLISQNMNLVAGVIYADDGESLVSLKKLAGDNLFLGGTSGLCYAAAVKLKEGYHSIPFKPGKILTFFPDRGELYWDTLYKNI